ncbi:MAG: DinB family protein [Ilumatobacteraceae bacterium]
MTFQAPEAEWPDRDLDERATLDGFLEGYRAVLLHKATGLDRAQLSTALAPSTLTLGGLVKHMALVEDIWFTQRMAGDQPPEPWASADWEADEDWDFHSAPDDEPADLRALFDTAVDRSRAIAAAHDLDDVAAHRGADGAPCTLRWIYVHMIEEYARHCGHADLIRESIDGTTGD